MKVFDLHCDTITVLEERAESLLNNKNCNISLEKASCFEKYRQVYAVFIPDELRGREAAEYFERVYAYYQTQNKGLNEKYGFVLAVEGGSACGGSLEGIERLRECSVEIMTLTWNADNEIASGCFSENDNGFTAFGKQALRRLEECSITPDVSHLGRKSFSQLVSLATKPFIASHSDCDIVENYAARKRNISDEGVREIIACGGLIGINFCRDFLGNGEDTSFGAVRRHMEHILELGGEKVLALGSDYDGCTIHPDLDSVEKLVGLYYYLIESGFGKKLCDDIFYGNANRFFENK